MVGDAPMSKSHDALRHYFLLCQVLNVEAFDHQKTSLDHLLDLKQLAFYSLAKEAASDFQLGDLDWTFLQYSY